MDFEAAYVTFSGTVLFLFLMYYIVLFADPKRKLTSEEVVEEKVEEMKKLAVGRDIPEMISELYLEKLRYYPELFSGEQTDNLVSFMKASAHIGSCVMPPSIIKIQRIDNGTADYIELTLKSKKTFQIYFNEYTKNRTKRALLDILHKDKKLFSLEYEQNEDEVWQHEDEDSIRAFIDGPWENDFQKLANEINSLEEEKNEDKKERASKKKPKNDKKAAKKEKINKLKNDFGI